MTRVHYAITITVAVGALFGVLLLRSRHTVPPNQAILTTPTSTLTVSVADTEASREQGLSGTVHLQAKTGKLFIFEHPDTYGFWMKDMHYPLDLVWITSDLVVAGITTNATPESYPSVFYPPLPVQYVLELNAYEAPSLGLYTGAQLQLKRNF